MEEPDEETVDGIVVFRWPFDHVDWVVVPPVVHGTPWAVGVRRGAGAATVRWACRVAATMRDSGETTARACVPLERSA